MNNAFELFGKKVAEKRKALNLTQKQLAEKLGMSHRTIMQIEICRSNPKFETVIILAQYLNISLDATIFPSSTLSTEIPKCVSDYFSTKNVAQAESLIEICKMIDTLGGTN